MDTEVSPEVALDAKPYPAHLADKGFIQRVDDRVLHQRSLQLECLAAVGAPERPLLGVHSLVREQMSRSPETLPTGGTAEGLFSGVNGPVLLQDALGSKSFAAGVADERSDSGVDQLVSFQQTHRTIRLLTDGALEGVLCFMAQLVSLEMLLEPEVFVTLAARPHFLTVLLSGLLYFVGLEVSLERLFLVEAFTALIAGERLVVTSHVLLQLMSVVEAFVALLTKDLLLLMPRTLPLTVILLTA